ncbi:MAG: hypothetical protein PHF00_09395, partial [Elusimicrobia bacterium]|nr:hypothetical protein [Elusimicrobiota bacterium]
EVQNESPIEELHKLLMHGAKAWMRRSKNYAVPSFRAGGIKPVMMSARKAAKGTKARKCN